MNDRSGPDLRSARAAWQTRDTSAPQQIVGIAASVTAAPLEPFLWWHAKSSGLPETRTYLAPFNQVRQALVDPSSTFGADVDVFVILWRIEDLFPKLVADYCRRDAGTLPELIASCRGLAAEAVKMQERTGKLVVFGLPPPIHRPDADLGSLFHGRSLMAAHRAVVDAIEEEIRQSRVLVLDTATSIALHGIEAAHDWRKWYLYRQPYTEEFWWRVAHDLVCVLRSAVAARKKCLVIDCDNTLWGGVVGEDGISGIALGEDFPGSAFVDFQRQIKQLVDSGVFLAIASKNNIEDVWQVFDTHDAMILSRNDVSVAEISWGPKPEAIVRIAKTLNIGLDAIVFVDDSAIEIAAVRERLPDVTCLQVPEDEPSDLPFLLTKTRQFDVSTVTAEDAERTQMFLLEARREEIKMSSTPEDFRRSLALELTFGEVKAHQVARVAQLINKTNQFNLTTRRRSEAEIAALLADRSIVIYALDVSDRFGRYGLVGASIARLNGSSAEIDTFVLSCRALGRGVEQAFIGAIAHDIVLRGKTELRASYLPTAKNAVCAEFLPSVGFSANGPDTYVAAPSDLLAIDPAIVVKHA